MTHGGACGIPYTPWNSYTIYDNNPLELVVLFSETNPSVNLHYMTVICFHGQLRCCGCTAVSLWSFSEIYESIGINLIVLMDGQSS